MREAARALTRSLILPNYQLGGPGYLSTCLHEKKRSSSAECKLIPKCQCLIRNPGSSLSLGNNLGSPSSVPAEALSLCCPRSRPTIRNPVITQGSPSPRQCHPSPPTRSRGGHD